MQLMGTHVWVLRGLEALARTAPLIKQILVVGQNIFAGDRLLLGAGTHFTGEFRASFRAVLLWLRFASRAGEVCATMQNGWWTGGASMSESQVYPRSFGRAVLLQQAARNVALWMGNHRGIMCNNKCGFFYVRLCVQVAMLLRPICDHPADAVIAMASRLVVEIPLELIDLDVYLLSA